MWPSSLPEGITTQHAARMVAEWQVGQGTVGPADPIATVRINEQTTYHMAP